MENKKTQHKATVAVNIDTEAVDRAIEKITVLSEELEKLKREASQLAKTLSELKLEIEV